MGKVPAVPVIMLVYNSGKYLDRSINSAVTQTFKSIEVINVDDCSSDGHLRVLEKFQKKNKRIRVG